MHFIIHFELCLSLWLSSLAVVILKHTNINCLSVIKIWCQISYDQYKEPNTLDLTHLNLIIVNLKKKYYFKEILPRVGSYGLVEFEYDDQP